LSQSMSSLNFSSMSLSFLVREVRKARG